MRVIEQSSIGDVTTTLELTFDNIFDYITYRYIKYRSDNFTNMQEVIDTFRKLEITN